MDRYNPHSNRPCRIYSASRRRYFWNGNQVPRLSFMNSSNYRYNNRNFRPSYEYFRDGSPEAPFRGFEAHEIPIRRPHRRYDEEDSYDARGPSPSSGYYSPPAPSPSPSEGEFHTVPVFSGPFPINHIPGTHPLNGRFDDRLAILGPFLLHNIPYVPGAIPIHHIPYIPGPDNVPHCPVLYEPDENDAAYTFPGYSILVPVPYGAIPAVQMFILPSEFSDGPSHVLIFQHGYMLRQGPTHFLYLRDIRNPNHIPHMPGPVFHQYVYRRNERREIPPPLGMRIGRQPPPPRPRRRRINNNTQFVGPSFEYFRGLGRRSTGRSLYRDNRAHRFRRTLHSCGSNDPAHNCLSDQNRRRHRTVSPRTDSNEPKVGSLFSSPERSESNSPEIPPNNNNNNEQEDQNPDAPSGDASPPSGDATAPSGDASQPSDDSSLPSGGDASPPPPPPEDPGEGTSVPKRKTSRYRPSYSYLRNPSGDPKKKKTRNLDGDGNRVPTYRQAVHYCTKYHEKQSRRKFRQQRRSGQMVEQRFGQRTLFDDWVGDCTTTESESDSSFITDEGGDDTVPGNSEEMLSYYYEIKALKDEEKKMKEEQKKKKAEEKKLKDEVDKLEDEEKKMKEEEDKMKDDVEKGDEVEKDEEKKGEEEKKEEEENKEEGEKKEEQEKNVEEEKKEKKDESEK